MNYPFRTGLINNQGHDAVQPGREIMIPTVMKSAGYATASVGKWGADIVWPGRVGVRGAEWQFIRSQRPFQAGQQGRDVQATPGAQTSSPRFRCRGRCRPRRWRGIKIVDG
jgi:arylsulfatase A-like enzyme